MTYKLDPTLPCPLPPPDPQMCACDSGNARARYPANPVKAFFVNGAVCLSCRHYTFHSSTVSDAEVDVLRWLYERQSRGHNHDRQASSQQPIMEIKKVGTARCGLDLVCHPQWHIECRRD